MRSILIPKGKKVNKEFLYTLLFIVALIIWLLLAAAGVKWAVILFAVAVSVILLIGAFMLLYGLIADITGHLFIDKDE